MLAAQSEKQLRSILRANGTPLKTMSAATLIRTMVDFWLQYPAEDTIPHRGDGILAYWDLLNRGRTTDYEFGLTRLFRIFDGHLVQPALTLRMSLGYVPTLEVFQLDPAASSIVCWDRSSADSFVATLLSLPATGVVSGLIPRSSGIALEERQCPPHGGADNAGAYHWGAH